MSKSSTSVTRKALKLDDKVKAMNLCEGGKSYLAVTEYWLYQDNEHS